MAGSVSEFRVLRSSRSCRVLCYAQRRLMAAGTSEHSTDHVTFKKIKGRDPQLSSEPIAPFRYR